MANPIIDLMNRGQNPGMSVMMQAVGAMIRGESPQQFLQNLAKTNPQLQGLDLNNPEAAAQQLCEKNGEDYNAAKASIRDKIGQFIANK